VAQYHVGRLVGTSYSSRDVHSTRARLEAGIEIHSLGTSSEQREEWLECLTDNRRTPVPDQAHFRLEFPRWLGTQTNRNRQIAEMLAFGYSTGEVARKFNISSGRVSQIRRELHESWNEFNGESQPVSAGWSRTKVAPAN
jgi:DNA-binding NarL/FixJ family response regulator